MSLSLLGDITSRQTQFILGDVRLGKLALQSYYRLIRLGVMDPIVKTQVLDF